MATDHIYDAFCDYIKDITTERKLDQFKENINVTYVLEHVDFIKGLEYLITIYQKTPVTEQQIIGYCLLNDRVGGGVKYDYGFIKTSPTNFRYILHAHLILSHIKNSSLTSTEIVEIGCGYGGLYLALDYFSEIYGVEITNYHLVDLPTIVELQRQYLSHYETKIPQLFHDACQFGDDITNNGLFLVSNYCFSEISHENQQQYIERLFPKVAHGFITWNAIPVFYFGFNITEETEYPLTGPLNEYIYF